LCAQFAIAHNQAPSTTKQLSHRECNFETYLADTKDKRSFTITEKEVWQAFYARKHLFLFTFLKRYKDKNFEL
jgi:hypothetical protein